MATIKIKFIPGAGDIGIVAYQVIHARAVRIIRSEFRINKCDWDPKTSTVRDDAVMKSITSDAERLLRIIRNFDARRLPYTADDIVLAFHRFSTEGSLSNFMTAIINRLKANGKVRTSETYKSALCSFMRFMDGKEILLDCMTADVIEDYEAYLQESGLTPNSTSFYMRILRATFNRAVERNLVDQTMPFRHVYTGIEKTVKRALPVPVVKKIKNLDLSGHRSLDYARDMFMMSFYLRGMSFIDMSFLRKTDLKNGYVTYRRRKTGQQLVIRWTKGMSGILKKYPENSSDYLLPIIRTAGGNERCTYRNLAYTINSNLKKIASMLGIETSLTLYVARHSWASVAKSKGVPVSVISQGMGHDSEMTTRIYLASLDTSLVDKANALVIASI